MSTGRRLGTIETALALTDRFSPLNLVTVLELEGPSLEPFLPAGLEVAQRRRPILTGRIVAGRGGFDLQPGRSSPIPVRGPAAGQGWQDVVEEELNERIDLRAGPLARCRWVPASADPDGRARLIVTLQHCIADGVCTASLLHDLLGACATLVEGGEPKPPEAVAPASPADALLPHPYRGAQGVLRSWRFLFRQGIDEAGYRARTGGPRRPNPTSGRSRTLLLRFDQAETDALVRRARHERVTPASALGAAMLLATNQALHGSRARPMRAVAFGNLRPSLRPPLSPEQMAAALYLLRVTLEVDPGQGLWPLARALQASTHRTIRRGDRFAGTLAAPHLVRMQLRTRSRLCHTALSYTGVSEVEPAYGPIAVHGLHAFVSDNVLGAELAGLAGLFGGRFWWNGLYTDTVVPASAASSLAEHVRTILMGQAG